MKRLERLARDFIGDAQDLLNRTVTTGIRISVVNRTPQECVAAVGITKAELKPRIVPLRLGAKTSTAHLRVAYSFEMDPEDTHLAVANSNISIFADASGREDFVHYDYDRHRTNAYANPHVQVGGESNALARISQRAGRARCQLGDIHFPVGDRRFRPSLEDVIEMLAVEGLVSPRAGWEAVVEQHRQRWREIQVKATVRRHTGWAAEELQDHGWTVLPPSGDRPSKRRLPEVSAANN